MPTTRALRPLTAALGLLVLAALVVPPGFAATPPALVHYEGVLRDANNNPLNGSFAMAFVFWSAASGGDQIMIDEHRGSLLPPAPFIQVTNGLFSVALGSGKRTDGAGPGTIVSLADVFRFYGDVWMEIQIGSPAESLSPRVHILSSAYAENANALGGHLASEYVDTTSTAQTKTGRLTLDDASSTPGYGVTISSAGSAALYAAHKTASGSGYLGDGDIGVWGGGNYSGGYFQSANASGSALLGYGNVGVQGDGRVSGGTFTQSDGHGTAYLGLNGTGATFYNSGTGYAALAQGDYGVVGTGTWPNGAGGYFYDPYYNGTAICAVGNSGIVGSGSYQGGEFYDSDNTGHAHLGFGAIGVYGIGNETEDYQNGSGGHFTDVSGSGEAWAAKGDYGIYADGNSTGGHFSNSYGSEAYLPYNSTGVLAIGSDTGGYYSDYYSAYAYLAYWNGSSAYTIVGNGAKSFVQNHPEDPGKSVVFVALEGDEAGTYTRGQGRTANGVAHVTLSSSFGLVTNPDVGLTATVTPRGGAVTLAIESLTTGELVVRAPAGADDVTFDYTVFGLRLGFESMPIVQPRVDDAPLPSPAAAQLDVTKAASESALARFAAMRGETGDRTPLDLSHGQAMRAAIGIAKEGRPDRPKDRSPHATGHAPVAPTNGTGAAASPTAAASPATPGAASMTTPAAQGRSPAGSTAQGAAAAAAAGPDRFPAGSMPIAVDGEVHGGDVVAFPSGGGTPLASPATSEAGGVALGIVAGDPETAWSGMAPLALGGSVVRCRVDATGGPVAVGDLLTVSSVPGYARRGAAGDAGPVVAKALEPIAEGRGVIRVLAVAR